MSKVSTTVYSKQGVPVQIEGTGDTTDQAIVDLYAGVDMGVKQFGWTLEPPASKTPSSPAQAPAAGPIRKEAAKAPSEKPIQQLRVGKMKSTPKPEGKVEIGLYEQGHQYVDIYYTATIEKLLEELEPTGIMWGAEDFQVAREFLCEFIADWVESDKRNTNGNPYKNIVGFRSVNA